MISASESGGSPLVGKAILARAEISWLRRRFARAAPSSVVGWFGVVCRYLFRLRSERRTTEKQMRRLTANRWPTPSTVERLARKFSPSQEKCLKTSLAQK